MKHIVTQSSLLRGALAGALVSFSFCHAIAAGTPTPTPAAGSGTAAAPATSAISASLGSEGPNMDDDVVARSGVRSMTVKDIRAIIETLDPAEQTAMASDPAMLKRVVFSLLLEPMVLNEINSKKWSQTPAIKAHLERMQQTALVNLYLKDMATPPADYPGEAELKKAYEERKGSFIVPHQFQISQIFIALPADADRAATEKAQKKLETVINALKQPDANFAAIAHAQSDDARAAEQGGDMGWVQDIKMPPRIRMQAILLPKDTLSAPIRLQDGWHIMKVTDTKEPGPLAFEDARPELTRELRAERAKANLQAYIQQLVQQSPIIIDDKTLPEIIARPGN